MKRGFFMSNYQPNYSTNCMQKCAIKSKMTVSNKRKTCKQGTVYKKKVRMLNLSTIGTRAESLRYCCDGGHIEHACKYFLFKCTPLSLHVLFATINVHLPCNTYFACSLWLFQLAIRYENNHISGLHNLKLNIGHSTTL